MGMLRFRPISSLRWITGDTESEISQWSGCGSSNRDRLILTPLTGRWRKCRTAPAWCIQLHSYSAEKHTVSSCCHHRGTVWIHFLPCWQPLQGCRMVSLQLLDAEGKPLFVCFVCFYCRSFLLYIYILYMWYLTLTVCHGVIDMCQLKRNQGLVNYETTKKEINNIFAGHCTTNICLIPWILSLKLTYFYKHLSPFSPQTFLLQHPWLV